MTAATEYSTQDLAKALEWNGDYIAGVFIDTLHEANFHTEGKVIRAVWEAMQWATPAEGETDRRKVVAAAIDSLLKLSRTI